ncbi:MAG TPA: UDP-N-acetylmuramoyl-L-alanyl-D-glutamate--2,6-diaminopimelate ligase [Rhodanobacteraceae bacterium]|nr:UDP-N-acetylmuramoyl-L-alanyl-D-glutamate--2,6-diaminopimelate ligase [Rhodanobacteraceae bacterium]
MVVHGLTLDSRRVHSGDAFVALRGGSAHGITFAPAALASGASVVIAEAPAPVAQCGAGARDEGPGASKEQTGARDEGRGASEEQQATKHPAVHAPDARDEQRDAIEQRTLAPRPSTIAPVIWIDHLRDHVGEIAARFFGRPAEAMRVIGVTGTNGKTSIVQLLATALEALGARAATIGTLGAGLVGAVDAGERTTPDVISVHGLLAQFRDAGATDVAMEVSSHALDQGRVNAVAFKLAVFTNLTRDHLDYHGDMNAYGAAKARLFAWPRLHAAVINIDDAFGRELASGLAPGITLLRYSLDDATAEIRARDIRSSNEGLRLTLVTPWGEGEIATPLLGRFNVGNLLAVAGCLGALDYTFVQIHKALAQLKPVAGRMNRIGGQGDLPLVVVDYSHTPDALEQALTSLRAHCAGRLICVFGCGGERDQGKRPQMGAIAERLSDRVIITDDNPRGEDGDFIVAQIVAGLSRPAQATVQRDRAHAIALALGQAQRGDAVLIAGKGHEPYQEIRGIRHPFDDLDVARRALQARTC